MMKNRRDANLMEAIVAEFRRIGLVPEEMPGVVVRPEELAGLLERLKGVPVSSSWGEIFPNAPPPTHWQPELKDWPKPIGAFDDIAPEGAAIVAHFETSVSDSDWDAMVAEIRARGFPLHSAGILEKRRDMLITGLVFRSDVTPDASRATVELVSALLEDQPGIMSLWIPRYGFGGGEEGTQAAASA